MSRKRAQSANRVQTDDVRNLGGKELVLKRLVNHYRALSNAKPKIQIEEPHKHVDANKSKGGFKSKIKIIQEYIQKQEFYNVRQTYKGVSNVKPMVDANKPFTFDMGKGNKIQKGNEKFEDFEHIRRLNAMSKRILSLGKVF